MSAVQTDSPRAEARGVATLHPPRPRRPFSFRRPVAASAEPLRDAPIRRWAMRVLLGDVLAGVLAALLARIFRFGFDDAVITEQNRVSYAIVGMVFVFAWPTATALAGAYSYRVSLFGVEELRRLLRAAFGMLATIGLVHFVFQLDVVRGVARGFVGLFIPLAVIFSAIWRIGVRSRIGRDRAEGFERHRAVVVGPAAEVERTRVALATMRRSPIDVVAYVADDLDEAEAAPAALADLHRLPSRSDVNTARDSGIGFDLLLRAGRPEEHELWRLARRAHENHVGLAIAPGRNDNTNVAVSYVPLGSTPLLLVETPSLSPSHRIAKGVFDRGISLLLVVVLAPLLVAVALTILVRDGRPVLFRHGRVGKDGVHFKVWKFRTMVPNSEDRLLDLLTEGERATPLFKVRDDPRVTKMGRLLRRYSLDELPQLFNVLAGEMSLVGPRPQIPAEVATYDERTARRLLVKPGMTGLWQTQGRNDMPWDEGVYLDLMYVEQWSPLLDLVIMARTVKTVLRPHGAY